MITFSVKSLCAFKVFRTLIFIVVSYLLIHYPIVAQTFTESFEKGLNKPPWTTEGKGNTVSKDYSSSGKFSYKSEVLAKVISNPRSSIVFTGTNSVPKFMSRGETYGFRFSIYFPSNFKPDPVRETIMQFKGVADKCDLASNSPFRISLEKNNLSAMVRWTGTKCNTGFNYKSIKFGKVKPGQWHHFVVNVRWDYRSNGAGYLQVYMKTGSAPSSKYLVVNYKGPTGFNDAVGHYFKLGIYKFLWKDKNYVKQSIAAGIKKRVLYYDDIEIKKGNVLLGKNKAPTADAGSDKTVDLPANKITLNGSGNDPDGSITQYKWTQKSGPSSALLNNADTPKLAASKLQVGIYVFRLTVTDNNGASDSDDVLVTVNQTPNQDPNANAGSNKTITLPNNKVTLKGSATDSDGTVDSYLWSQQSGPSNANLKEDNKPTLEASLLVEGVYVFRLTVTDDDGAKDSDGVMVTVKPSVNQFPTADAGSTKHITLPTNQITLKGTGYDPDGTIDAQSWKQTSGPSNATLTGQNTFDLTASNLIEGTYVFKLTITDTNGATDTDGVQVIVHPTAANESPSANAGSNRTITLPTVQVTLNGSGSDPDGTIDSYQWTQKSGPSTATLSGAGTKNLTADKLIAGKYIFTLMVTDNGGQSSTDDVTVNVKPTANQAPVANAGPNKTITQPQNVVTLSGSGTDPDGNISKFEWQQTSGPKANLPGITSAKLDITDLIEGVYAFQLKVTDDQGDTDMDQVKVTVLAAPPSITSDITNTTCATSDGAISLNLTGGKSPFTYKWSNGTTTKNLNNLVSGEYQVTVTDNNQNSVSKSFTVASIKANLKINATIINATCADNNGSIDVEASGGTGPYTFEWSSKARTASLNQLKGGSYSLLVKDQNGCSKKFSFQVGIDPVEVIHDVTASVVNASCAGDDGSISLQTTGSQGPYNYVWAHGATGPSLNALEDGKYRVTISDKHGCFMETAYTVNQDPGPAKPTIIQSGDSLYMAQQFKNYQWFKDSVAIVGANQRSLKYTEAGTYSVQISNKKNCMASSDYYYAKDPPPSSIIGGESFTMQQVDIYPNPAINDINVRLYLNEPAFTSITIYDFQGRVMLTKELGIINSQAAENLRLDQYPSGTYLIRVKANKEILTRRFLKH